MRELRPNARDISIPSEKRFWCEFSLVISRCIRSFSAEKSAWKSFYWQQIPVSAASFLRRVGLLQQPVKQISASS
ncbi:MAG: hypothetical protein H0V70_20250 [Ktedonobacteraceae bacterium]|nr:hypothetical protein [Ktedonobacteraceae bacterium]